MIGWIVAENIADSSFAGYNECRESQNQLVARDFGLAAGQL
jgi:hypothetical protein